MNFWRVTRQLTGGMALCAAVLSIGCRTDSETAGAEEESRIGPSFESDLEFLEAHTEILTLSDASGHALVAIAPEYQGRVMTSTASGASGPSYGWINRAAISAGERQPHINVIGGEDRFWLGPEGGQFSIFFAAGDPFDLEHWQTPEPIDWGAWEVSFESDGEVGFRRPMEIVNYSGTVFRLVAERSVRLLSTEAAGVSLGIEIGGEVEAVAFESVNKIRNTGDKPWRRDTGLLSIWILGMFPPSPRTTVVVPFVEGSKEELGPVVNDAYFGKVPADRLRVGDGVVYFRADGLHRSKIGIGARRAVPILGGYDADRGVLSLVHFTLPPMAADYVNSLWEIQERPYEGDVVNSYNDGPPEPGAPPLGPFWELESSSPAAALGPGEELVHVHRTFHFQAGEVDLDAIARATLGVSLEAIRTAFQP